MIVDGKPYQSIWPDPTRPGSIHFINQNLLPFKFRVDTLSLSKQALEAIRSMKVRGAPLIGVTGAFGFYLACLEAEQRKDAEKYLDEQSKVLRSARPTAVNLSRAVDRLREKTKNISGAGERTQVARTEAIRIMEEEKEACYRIGRHGLELIRETALRKKGNPVNILTHCNAGWLACVDYGTATAPIYLAHDEGIPVHVWVDETRPRNQGARLTAWELGKHGVPHTVIVDNAGGHLMQTGRVDMVITGSDRTTRRGDVANKIGTYLKALAARDNEIPFYVALPSSSIDFSIRSGVDEIPIEERDPAEVRTMEGTDGRRIRTVTIMTNDSPVSNYGFDITPAGLVTGLITDKGICAASEEDIQKLFPKE